MQELIFEPGKFASIEIEQIYEFVLNMGFLPLLITYTRKYEYQPHIYPAKKLFVFIEGGMNVDVDGRVYNCTAGDLLIIPGDTMHSAVTYEGGCKFYWSEEII